MRNRGSNPRFSSVSSKNQNQDRESRSHLGPVPRSNGSVDVGEIVRLEIRVKIRVRAGVYYLIT